MIGSKDISDRGLQRNFSGERRGEGLVIDTS